MKIQNLILFSAFLLLPIYGIGQNNWYKQKMENGVSISFPGKPTIEYYPSIKTRFYKYFMEDKSNFFVLEIDSSKMIKNNDIFSESTINSITNFLTSNNKEEIISVKKTYYKGKKAVDIYFKKFLNYGFYIYHQTRAIKIGHVVYVLFYTDRDFDKEIGRKFFNSLEFPIDQKFTNHKVNVYSNNIFHFKYTCPRNFLELDNNELKIINAVPLNKSKNIEYIKGFIFKNKTSQPLILIRTLNYGNGRFLQAVRNLTYSTINFNDTSPDSIFDFINTLKNSKNFSVGLVDPVNKIIVAYNKLNLPANYHFDKGNTGLSAEFFGKEKIIQVDFVTNNQHFENDVKYYFLPFIKSLSFNYGYTYADYRPKNEVKDTLKSNLQTLIKIKSFINGYSSLYTSDGSGHAFGLKFSIKYPYTWRIYSGRRPHIVVMIKNKEQNASCAILVHKLDEPPTKEELIALSSPQIIKKEFSGINGFYYIKSNFTVLEGEPTLVIDYNIERERLGYLLKSRVRSYSIYYKSYMLQIQFYVLQIPNKNPIDLEQKFNLYEPLFDYMINSLILISKWDDD